MNRGHFILKDREVVEVSSAIEWARWFESADRHVAKTELEAGDAKLVVSTVFLGLDHNFTGKGRPVLFETMIFSPQRDEERQTGVEGRNEYDDVQWRYCTYGEAERYHGVIVAMLRSGQDPSDLSVSALLARAASSKA